MSKKVKSLHAIDMTGFFTKLNIKDVELVFTEAKG